MHLLELSKITACISCCLDGVGYMMGRTCSLKKHECASDSGAEVKLEMHTQRQDQDVENFV